MKRFLIALQFLTILPVKVKSRVEEKDFCASLLYFPLVGLLIGLLLLLSAFLLSPLPSLLKGAIILIISIIVTGGIHLDGFADTCDGFYGNRPKEEILKIMRDSHIGVMGVVGVASLLILKYSLIISLPQNILWKSLIMMATFSRWAQSFACFLSRYVRSEGKAKYFIEHKSKIGFLIGSIFTIVLFLLLAQLEGAAVLAVSILPVLLFMSYAKKKIGGMTGDTIGATSEIAETAALFFALIYLGR